MGASRCPARGDDGLRLCLAGSDRGRSAATAQHHARPSRRRQSNLDATQGPGRRRSRLNLRWQRRTRLQVLPRSARSLAAKRMMMEQGPLFRADGLVERGCSKGRCPTVSMRSCVKRQAWLESEQEEKPRRLAQKKSSRPRQRCRPCSVGGKDIRDALCPPIHAVGLSASFRRACRTADTTRWRTQRSAPGLPECPPSKFVALLAAGLMFRIAQPVRKLPQAQAIRKLTSGAIHPVRPDTSEPKHAIGDSASTCQTRTSCA
jgi:hypothetical protein